MREAVSNVARHSGATHVTVTLDVTDEVVVEVVDDGRGIEERGARSGLRNLEERARRRGGTASVERLPDGGPGSGGARRCADRSAVSSAAWTGGARSSVARTAAWVRRSRPSLARRCDT